MSALREAGVEVLERHTPVWDGHQDNWAARWRTGLRLAWAEFRLRFTPHDSFDAVVVGYPGHFDVPRARRVAGKRPLVFNPLVSLHESLVTDRKRFRQGLLAAWVLLAVDRKALKLSDLVVADTEANADFLARLGEIPRERVQVCLVGAEDRLFHAGWRPDEPFRFLFVGKLIPLLARDDPRGSSKRFSTSAPRTSSGCNGSTTRSFRPSTVAPSARSASSAPPTRPGG